MVRHALAMLVVLAIGSLGRADLSVALQNGNAVRGTLDPPGEVEEFLVEVPAGAVLILKAKALSKGPAVSARVLDDDLVDVGGNALFICDTGAHAVYALDLVRGGVHLLAGTPAAAGASLDLAPLPGALTSPRGVVFVDDSPVIADSANDRVLSVLFNQEPLPR